MGPFSRIEVSRAAAARVGLIIHVRTESAAGLPPIRPASVYQSSSQVDSSRKAIARRLQHESPLHSAKVGGLDDILLMSDG